MVGYSTTYLRLFNIEQKFAANSICMQCHINMYMYLLIRATIKMFLYINKMLMMYFNHETMATCMYTQAISMALTMHEYGHNQPNDGNDGTIIFYKCLLNVYMLKFTDTHTRTGKLWRNFVHLFGNQGRLPDLGNSAQHGEHQLFLSYRKFFIKDYIII